jgi:tRNA threonylcarbamoyladenosine biosynthesis protein TsaB
MNILGIKTDNPIAELYLVQDSGVAAKEIWQAHRELSSTIHSKIESVVQRAGLTTKDITGIVCFAGGGSFTGLRIGVSVANALAAALELPVCATSGSDWLENGVEQIRSGNVRVGIFAEPIYDRPAATTPPKK